MGELGAFVAFFHLIILEFTLNDLTSPSALVRNKNFLVFLIQHPLLSGDVLLWFREMDTLSNFQDLERG